MKAYSYCHTFSGNRWVHSIHPPRGHCATVGVSRNLLRHPGSRCPGESVPTGALPVRTYIAIPRQVTIYSISWIKQLCFRDKFNSVQCIPCWRGHGSRALLKEMQGIFSKVTKTLQLLNCSFFQHYTLKKCNSFGPNA